MIDEHYGHLARDSRQHAISLLDAFTLEPAVNAAGTSHPRPRGAAQQDFETAQEANAAGVDARWTPRLVIVASNDNEGADQQELREAL